MPLWKQIIDAVVDAGHGHSWLRKILKTRRRVIPISLNGTIQLLPRATVRDYLKTKLGGK